MDSILYQCWLTPTVERDPFSKETETPLRLFRVMGRHWAGARERTRFEPGARNMLPHAHARQGVEKYSFLA